METLQIRLTKGLIAEIQKLIERDIYSSTSEAVRDAVRRLILGPSEKIQVPERTAVEKRIQSVVKKELQKPAGTVPVAIRVGAAKAVAIVPKIKILTIIGITNCALMPVPLRHRST